MKYNIRCGDIMVKKRILIAISILSISLSVGLCVYPTVSNEYIESNIQEDITEFDTKVEKVEEGSFEEAVEEGKVDEQSYPINEQGERVSDVPIYFEVDLDRLYKDSVEYNESIKENQYSLLVNESSYVYPALDLTQYGIYDGIYGYVSAPSVDMQIPIYLGANDTTMHYGAGHMTYTSLPIGGESTNTVLTAHTGYIGRTFFDNIGNLEIGDEVYLTNYWGTLSYKVIDKEVHAPNDSQGVFIEEGKDLLTMITCVSDGYGGFNRYYVICERC